MYPVTFVVNKRLLWFGFQSVFAEQTSLALVDQIPNPMPVEASIKRRLGAETTDR